MKKQIDWLVNLLIINFVVWVITILIVLYIEFEGTINPVTEPLEIFELIETDSGWTKVIGQFEKIRNCKPIAIRWYKGTHSLFNGHLGQDVVPSRIGDPDNLS